MLIDEQGQSLGTTSREQALILAHTKNLDLVEVGPHAKPPVVKLVNWGKFKYQLEKKEKKSKSKGGTLKEIKLSLKIGAHDLETKSKRAKEFLEEGNKVGVFMQLYGREQMFAEQARSLLIKFKDEIGGQFEDPITRLGNRLSAVIVRKK